MSGTSPLPFCLLPSPMNPARRRVRPSVPRVASPIPAFNTERCTVVPSSFLEPSPGRKMSVCAVQPLAHADIVAELCPGEDTATTASINPIDVAYVVDVENVQSYDSTDDAKALLEFVCPNVPITGYYAACLWQDQGWGNRKGRIGIAGVVQNLFPDVAGHDLALATHHRKLPHGIQPGTKVHFEYSVGGGGGHSLSIHNLRVVLLTNRSFYYTLWMYRTLTQTMVSREERGVDVNGGGAGDALVAAVACRFPWELVVMVVSFACDSHGQV
eukprot:PhM_4_TR6788/c0_g1_i1/m.96323